MICSSRTHALDKVQQSSTFSKKCFWKAPAPVSFDHTQLSAVKHLITFTNPKSVTQETKRKKILKNVSRLTPKSKKNAERKQQIPNKEPEKWLMFLSLLSPFSLVSFNMLISSDSSTAFLGDRLLNTLLKYRIHTSAIQDEGEIAEKPERFRWKRKSIKNY